jgi:predicted ribosome quality control (RQC) complex YloA/Tae2 family protein
MKMETFEEKIIKIGQSAKENWDLIDNSNKNYIWLHLDSFPSCHIVIEDENPSNELLLEGARLCKDNTKYRNLKNLKICYTNISNLIKGNEIGSVSYKSNRKVKYIQL